MALSYSEVAYNFATSYSAPVIALYLVVVLLSRRLMKLFSPFDLRGVLIVHNLVCSLLSCYAVACFAMALWQVRDPFSKERDIPIVVHGFLVYWISKIYELLDTVFMILRHRGRQISFLHVFHHSSITMLADWGYFISPIPAAVPMMGLNSMVHVVMYGYYFLTALQPLHGFTWKKRITQMQLIQFMIALIHAVIGYLHHGFCVYCIMYAVSMMLLFGNFYYHAFIKKISPKGVQSSDGKQKVR